MRVVLGLLLICLAAGCVRFDRPAPQRDAFVLDVSRPGLPGDGAGVPLQVRRLKVSPRFAGTGFVYRTGEFRYETDYYSRFLTPPGSLLTEELHRWLAAAGFVDGPAVPSEAPADLVVEGDVPALYGDFRQRPEAVVELRLRVLDVRSARGGLLLERLYRQSLPLAENSPAGLAAGFNDALERILTAFESDLREVLPR